MNRWIDSIYQSRQRLAIPLMTHPGIELSGIKVIDAVTDGEKHFIAMKTLIDNFHPNVSVMNIMMDLTVEAEAFGSKISFSDDEVPNVDGQIVFDESSINALQIPSLNCGRLPGYLQAARLAVNNLQDTPVFAGCIGPVSLAGRLYGMTEMMTSFFTEPDSMKLLIQKCSVFILGYIKEFKSIGVNGIIMAEPAAGLLSADMCDEFSSSFIKDIVAQVQDENFVFILHNCGNTGHVTQSMLSTGAKALHLGNKIDILKTLDESPDDILILGNLDPVGVLKMMSPEQVFNETMNLLKQTSGYKNFIISTGCDTPPGVPLENVKAFFEAVKVYNDLM
ncbi:MAG: uroporphyrinogen decarboxylase family protein [bacterium]